MNTLSRRFLRVLPALAAVVMLPAGCGRLNGFPSSAEAPREFRNFNFTGEAVLSGTVILAGECLVPRGSTLRIGPGARLLFAVEDKDGDGVGDSRLRVEGTVVAVGDPSNPVFFSSAGDVKGERGPGDWDAVLLNFSKGNQFRHVVIEYSNYSLHAHFSEGSVGRSLIRRNNEGCRMGNCTFVLEENLIRDNVQKGLNFRNCANIVRRNEITANGNGIFIFEKDAGSEIKGNNIYGNERFNFRLDDFFTGEMVLDDDWWGSADEDVIRETIYDSRFDPEIGKVILRPAASARPLPAGFPFDGTDLREGGRSVVRLAAPAVLSISHPSLR